MSRVVLEALLFFVLPFVGFAIWLVATNRPVMSSEAWRGSGGWLVIAGLAAVILSFIWLGATSERGSGPYEPSHIENGRIVPGRIR
jgi:hypothetical protein